MSKTILIVDDDPNILETAKDILEDAGYTVHAEGTGAGALQVLKSIPVDAALFDFNLPDATGVELAAQAKQLRPRVVVFLLTGEATVDLGPNPDIVDLVLTKPVNPAQLLKVIRD